GALPAAAVSGGLGLAGVAGAQVALAAVSALCFWWLARTYVAWFGVSRPARAETRSLASLAAWLAGGDLIAKLLLGSDVLILGTLLSPAAVTTYVLTAYAPRAAVAVHGSAVGAAMPGLAGLIGAGQYGRAALARGDLMVLTWLFATAVGTTILLWNRSFVALWVGREHYGGAVVDLLIVCIAFQTAFVRADEGRLERDADDQQIDDGTAVVLPADPQRDEGAVPQENRRPNRGSEEPRQDHEITAGERGAPILACADQAR